MVRKLSWLVALSALWISTAAFALGLGDIDLHSGLNQPLDADIELLSVRPGEADGIRISLGSAEDFSRAGLERTALLNQLRFSVVAGGKGRYTLHVATEQAVREPFLDFLVHVIWKNGELLREYTVLLDPPVLMPAPAPVPVITAPTSQPAARPVAPAPAAAPVPTSVSTPAPARVTDDSYGPVSRTDTLWGVAIRTRPDASVNVEQMMQALLRANPDAFIDNNINNLRAGRILRVPSAADINAISPEEAHRATLQQNDAWRNRRSTVAAAPAPQPVAAPSEEPPADAGAPEQSSEAATEQAPAPAEPVEEQAQLKVVAPQPEEVAAAPVAGAPAEAEAAAETPSAPAEELHKELALTTEAMETQRQETEDLRNRLTDLEQQIATMQKLMAIKDQQLAAVQAKGGATPAAGEQGQREAPGLLDNPATLAMIGVVAVVLAALLWITLRRRQDGAPAPVMASDLRSEPSRRAPERPVVAKNTNHASAAAPNGVAAAAAIRAAAHAAGPDASAPQVRPSLLSEPPLPESNPMSEADIFLAYGRYQQAEDLIKEAMQHDRNPALKFKLLEIYYASKNATAFEDTARDLRDEVGAEDVLWEKVLPMGRDICPYSLLFSADQGVDSGEFSLDIGLAPTAGSGDKPVAAPGEVAFNLEEGFDADAGAGILDEVGTKLDLARAYIDMGDPAGARSILDEVLQEGDDKQQAEAQQLLKRITS